MQSSYTLQAKVRGTKKKQVENLIPHSLTAEEEDVECLVRAEDDQIRTKHNSSRLLEVVVYLHCRVARTTVCNHSSTVSGLEGLKLQ